MLTSFRRYVVALVQRFALWLLVVTHYEQPVTTLPLSLFTAGESTVDQMAPIEPLARSLPPGMESRSAPEFASRDMPTAADLLPKYVHNFPNHLERMHELTEILLASLQGP